MTGGQQLEDIHKLVARAAGRLVTMLVKMYISRSALEACLRDLDEATTNIRSMLTGERGQR